MYEQKETIMTDLGDHRIHMVQDWLTLNADSYGYAGTDNKHEFTLKEKSQNELFMQVRNFREFIGGLGFS